MQKWLLLYFLLVPVSALGTHGHWIDHYKNADSISCCGVHDCLKIPMRIMKVDEKSITVDIPSRQAIVDIPRQSYHPSEDEHDYWCAVNPKNPPTTNNTRCVFIAVGG